MPGRTNPGAVPAACRADRRARRGDGAPGRCGSSPNGTGAVACRSALGPTVLASDAGTVSVAIAASGRPLALADMV
jgi:hypothetical protein